MSSPTILPCADAAAGASNVSNPPKRRHEVDGLDAGIAQSVVKRARTDEGVFIKTEETDATHDLPQQSEQQQQEAAALASAKPPGSVQNLESKATTASTNSKSDSISRRVRLDQNRKAAKESRRRKKIMIEELQRSVIFFSRANGTLKQQNEELSRMLIQARTQISSHVTGDRLDTVAPPMAAVPMAAVPKAPDTTIQVGNAFNQAEAQTVATQAMYETQGFSASAARAVAQAINGKDIACNTDSNTVTSAPGTTGPGQLSGNVGGGPLMQPGSTMQAMASFQQAAAAAMQAAIRGMENIPGLNLNNLNVPTPAGINAQQAYTDAMTALAMQQAAYAAAAGHAFTMQPAMQLMTTWSVQQQQHQQQEQEAPPAVQTTQAHHDTSANERFDIV